MQYFKWKSYFSLCKYKFTRDKIWALDLATWNSLHNARLSRSSMLYNPRQAGTALAASYETEDFY